jgi:acyl-CoA dehydrogenase
MDRPWPEEAIEYEMAVRGALTRAGGVDLARRCEVDPSLRERELRPVLEDLGLLALEITAGEAESAAAARAMRAAGSFVCPWPLVQQLAVPEVLRHKVDAVYLSDVSLRRAEHLDLAGRAMTVDIATGDASLLHRTGGTSHMPLDPFGVPCEPTGGNELAPPAATDSYVVLAAFWVLGAMGHARDLAADHARERRQFGRRIADFGGIQWHLSDIAVAHDSLWELASFNLARLIDRKLTRADTLALHYTTLQSAHAVLSHSHQIHGAIGLCDEHDLTVINRHLQPMLRRPAGPTRILGLLADEIEHSGFDNLYPVPAAAVVGQPVQMQP